LLGQSCIDRALKIMTKVEFRFGCPTFSPTLRNQGAGDPPESPLRRQRTHGGKQANPHLVTAVLDQPLFAFGCVNSQ